MQAETTAQASRSSASFVGDEKEVFILRKARAHFFPLTSKEAKTAPQELDITLPHKWDSSYPGLDGRAIYRIELPQIGNLQTPMALVIPRIGNQIAIRLNGSLITEVGTLGDSRTSTKKSPFWVQLPSALFRPYQSNLLEIETTIQSERRGGLSEIYFGNEHSVSPFYADPLQESSSLSIAVIVTLSLLCFITAGLWWVQRDPLFVVFAFCALSGIIRPLDRLITEPPIPWQYWSIIITMLYCVHILLMLRFAVQFLSTPPKWVFRVFWIQLAFCLFAVFCSIYFRIPAIYSVALASFFILGIAIIWLCLLAIQRGPFDNRVFAMTTIFLVIMGMRNFLLIRVSDGINYSYQSHALLIFELLMALVVINRFAKQVQNYRDLNAALASKIASRESELSKLHLQRLEDNKIQVTLQERQRIMRDIHDGVGSQLVGLLSLMKNGDIKTSSLQAHVTAAMDELRMAVDATQPMNGDLTTVLATLRFRLQPRLEAAGIAMIWEVEELPIMVNLTPDIVLQIQRILLEAFTNILRHARATQVVMKAYHQPTPSAWILEVSDNGVGLPSNTNSINSINGHGMRNMHARAAAISAILTLSSKPSGGTLVKMILPFK